MKVVVRQISETEYRVGNKVVYKDSEDRLVSRTELTEDEANAFYNYIGKRNLSNVMK